MSGRGRGRGALARWEAAKTIRESSTRVGSSVLSLSREHESKPKAKQSPGDSVNNHTLARVTHIIDVEHFWAQTGTSDELKQFDTYMTALNSWCNEQQRSSVEKIPTCGQAVCVFHSSTGQWRRGQVTRPISNSMLDVFYLDYGQSECVPLDRVCHPSPSDIMSRPVLAQYITLDGVKPIDGSWSEEANKRFSELVSSRLKIHFIDNFRGKLYLRNRDGEETSVGDVLISEGLAKSPDDVVNKGIWNREVGSGHQKDSSVSVLSSDQQKRLDEQWNPLTFHPAESRQPLWQKSNSFITIKDPSTKLPISLKDQSSQRELFNLNRSAFSPPQVYGSKSQRDTYSSAISLNDVPLPPKPDFEMQNKEKNILETFNVKRTDPGPVESLRSARPYLASPSAFLTQSQTGHSSTNSVLPSNESPLKYQPPHLRFSQPKMNEANAPSTEPKLENFTSLAQSRNSSFQSVQRLPQSPFSNFSFSPKQGRSNIAAQFQTNNSTNVGDNSAITQPLQQQTFQPWQQSECLKTQPLNENTRDEELKAELKWKIWKFQRNVKKLIDHMAVGDNGDYLQELDKLIADTRISQEFPGVSEVSVTVKLLLEKVINNVKFENVAVKVCTLFRDMHIPDAGDLINKEVMTCQKQLMDQSALSDICQRCQRFSSFLGKLYLEVLNENDSNGLKPSVDSIIANSLHNWLSFDQAESVAIHNLKAECLTGFLRITGPKVDRAEGNDISRYFATIRDLVLSPDLAVPVKSTLLDILLLRASGWKIEDEVAKQESEGSSMEDEVLVEPEDDLTEEQQFQEGTGNEGDSEEWDPYCKVKSMLENLKLQDLFQKFFDNCIRDSLLTADWEELKRTLQEAGFPPGVILEIRMYLNKGLLEENVTKILKPPAHKIINASSAGKMKEMKNKPPRSPSPTKSNESSIAINQLNQELQQLMIEGKQDKGAQRVSPTKKLSSLNQQTGHEGTPYNRAGTRKFVSKAERRRSSEGLPEEVSYLLPDYADSLYERMAPSPHAPVEPSNKRPTVETIAESQTVSSVSYSAVLKGVSQETTKPGAAKTKESQSKTFSRPPPGFPPLPTHGGDTKMHMTVLGNKSKTKTPGPSNSTPRNNTPTRADASMNWRNDGRQEPRNQTTIQPVNPSPSGQGVKWRSYDDTVSQTESKAPPMSGASSDASSQRGETPQEDQASVKSDESNEPPPIVQPHRVFGPGGLKACVICGSKEHLRCNDRSKMFMD